MKTYFTLAGMVTLLAACSESDMGTGLNTVDRKYNKPAAATFDASVAALKSFDLVVDSSHHDDFGGEIKGHRADGAKVFVNVEAIDRNSCSASVRIDPGDSRMAEMVQDRMAQELAKGPAKESVPTAKPDVYPYDADIKGAVDAAERACEALGYTVTGKEIKDTWARVDGRSVDFRPVQFKIEHQADPEFPVKVTFIALEESGETSQLVAGQMHDEFDRQLGGHVK